MIEFIIGKNDSGLRADRFLMKATSAPSSMIYKSFRKKDVKIDGKHIKDTHILSEGEVLRIYISDEFRTERTVAKCPLTAKIVYEDENIILFDKPSGLPCQSDSIHKDGTLTEMLKSYLLQKGDYLQSEENSFSPSLCNRLDTNTTGLVIGAKNAAVLRDMNEQIRLRNVKKYYICRTEGIPPKKSDTVFAHIEKDEKSNKSHISDSGKSVSMQYRVLSEDSGVAEVEVLLHTGRSHQIRAYFASVGCPLAGDKKYGAKSFGGQQLRAYKIKFDFPNDYDGILSYLRGREIVLK